MDYKELAEAINAGDIKVGDKLFITDFRHGDILNKPIRNIAPTEVILFPNTELPPRKTVYYADYHFRPVGKNGAALSTIIAPYDNTGYRGYTGISVNIFRTLAEAKAVYIEQCEKVLEQAQSAQDIWMRKFEEIKINAKAEIRKNN